MSRVKLCNVCNFLSFCLHEGFIDDPENAGAAKEIERHDVEALRMQKANAECEERNDSHVKKAKIGRGGTGSVAIVNKRRRERAWNDQASCKIGDHHEKNGE